MLIDLVSANGFSLLHEEHDRVGCWRRSQRQRPHENRGGTSRRSCRHVGTSCRRTFCQR